VQWLRAACGDCVGVMVLVGCERCAASVIIIIIVIIVVVVIIIIIIIIITIITATTADEASPQCIQSLSPRTRRCFAATPLRPSLQPHACEQRLHVWYDTCNKQTSRMQHYTFDIDKHKTHRARVAGRQ